MTPADRDINIIRGDYYSHVIQLDDTTSYSFDANISSQGASVGLFDVAVVGHLVTISLPAATTSTLALKPYHWRFRRLDSQARPETLIRGTVRVT